MMARSLSFVIFYMIAPLLAWEKAIFDLKLEPPDITKEFRSPEKDKEAERRAQTKESLKSATSLFLSSLIPIIPAEVSNNVFKRIDAVTTRLVESIDSTPFKTPLGFPCDPNHSRLCEEETSSTTVVPREFHRAEKKQLRQRKKAPESSESKSKSGSDSGTSHVEDLERSKSTAKATSALQRSRSMALDLERASLERNFLNNDGSSPAETKQVDAVDIKESEPLMSAFSYSAPIVSAFKTHGVAMQLEPRDVSDIIQTIMPTTWKTESRLDFRPEIGEARDLLNSMTTPSEKPFRFLQENSQSGRAPQQIFETSKVEMITSKYISEIDKLSHFSSLVETNFHPRKLHPHTPRDDGSSWIVIEGIPLGRIDSHGQYMRFFDETRRSPFSKYTNDNVQVPQNYGFPFFAIPGGNSGQLSAPHVVREEATPYIISSNVNTNTATPNPTFVVIYGQSAPLNTPPNDQNALTLSSEATLPIIQNSSAPPQNYSITRQSGPQISPPLDQQSLQQNPAYEQEQSREQHQQMTPAAQDNSFKIETLGQQTRQSIPTQSGSGQIAMPMIQPYQQYYAGSNSLPPLILMPPFMPQTMVASPLPRNLNRSNNVAIKQRLI